MSEFEIRYYCRRCASFADEPYAIKHDFTCSNCEYKLTKYELEIDADTGRRLTKPSDITFEIANGEEFNEQYCAEHTLNDINRAKEEANSKTVENSTSKDKTIMPPPEVKCPKCGSTQIQAVTRKWSLLTGFLTNRVDRICLNCKSKF